MLKARKYVVTKRFDGLPKSGDFQIVEQELPSIIDGEILLKVEWTSMEPYLRLYHSNFSLPYDQFGRNVAVVEQSKDPRFPVGTRVVTHTGWCDYCIVNTANNSEVNVADRVYKLPNMKELSPSYALGAVGTSGVTAYFGLVEIGQPKPGETVVVTGAAGAVGHLAGQIAKIKGCRVIGFAGSERKVKWLKDLGFDYAYNYKETDVLTALQEAAPNGVDIYFDNVGGEMSSTIINQMNPFGRVCCIGSIASYNSDQLPEATIIQPAVVFKQLRVQGILIFNYFDQWPMAFKEMVDWIHSGQLKVHEHITQGFENIFDAFLGMLQGDNFGKAVVQI